MFHLTNDPPRPKRLLINGQPKGVQLAMFGCLDLPPETRDLFDVDGCDKLPPVKCEIEELVEALDRLPEGTTFDVAPGDFTAILLIDEFLHWR